MQSFHRSTFFRSAPAKKGCRSLPVVSSTRGMKKFSSRRPLSVCSIQEMLYWLSSKPAIKTRSKSAMMACFLSSSRLASAKDKQPTVNWFFRWIDSAKAKESRWSPLTKVAPSRLISPLRSPAKYAIELLGLA